jgi:hypothetical protein
LTGSGSGAGVALLTIAANAGSSSRTATPIIAGHTLIVTQSSRLAAPGGLRIVQ